MQHKCKVTVIEKKLYPDLQEKYLADPKSGACDFCHVGDEFVFKRYGAKDDFWHMGNGTQCSEAWDCISSYVYAALQCGSIMRGWTNDERIRFEYSKDFLYGDGSLFQYELQHQRIHRCIFGNVDYFGKCSVNCVLY